MAQRTLLILALALMAGGFLLGGAVEVGSAMFAQSGERPSASEQAQEQTGDRRGPGDQPPFIGPGSRHHRPGGIVPHPTPSPTN